MKHFYLLLLILLIPKAVNAQGSTSPIGGLDLKRPEPNIELQQYINKINFLNVEVNLIELKNNLQDGVDKYYFPTKDRELLKSVVNNYKFEKETIGSIIIKIADEFIKLKNQKLKTIKVSQTQRYYNDNIYASAKISRSNLDKALLPSNINTLSRKDWLLKRKITHKLIYILISRGFENIATSLNDKCENDYSTKADAIQRDPTLSGQAKSAAIKQLEDEHNTCEKAADDIIELSYYYNYRIKALRLLNLFPVNSGAESEIYYTSQLNTKGYSVLRSALLTYNFTGKASFFSELYADYLGPVRIGIGTQISSKAAIEKDANGNPVPVDKSERKDESIQRILGGGGNFIIQFGYPLLAYKNIFETLRLQIAFAPKFSIDVPKIGTETGEVNWSSDTGLELGLFGVGLKSKVIPYLAHRSGFLAGNNNFYNYLDPNNTDLGSKNRSFFLHQTTFGLGITSLFRFGVNLYYGDPYVVKNFPVTVSLTIIPD